MLKTLMQVKVGRQSQRFNCLAVFGVLVIFASGLAELHAEMIQAVERTGSTEMRGMIEGETSIFDRLLSWSEFAPGNATWGAQASTAVSDPIELREEVLSPVLIFPSVVGMYQAGACSSLDSSSFSSNVPPAYAANLTSHSGLSDPIVLLFWRGREFLHIPDAPSSGLFRPPRQSLFDTAI